MALIEKQRDVLVVPGRSWKQMMNAAETMLGQPAFALATAVDGYELQARVPGGYDLAATVDGQVLTVVGKSRQRFVGGRTFGYVRERPVKASFSLPPDAAEAGVTSHASGGVLVVRIPRTACLDVEATSPAEAR